MAGMVTRYFDVVKLNEERLSELDEAVEKFAQKIVNSLKNGNCVYICGNGGSAADAQHIAGEFVGRYLNPNRGPYSSVALSTDTSIMTAVANDYSFEDIFLKQIQALGKEGDVLIAISTSGNSENIVRAVEYANAKGIYVIGLLGKDGGKLKSLVNKSIIPHGEISGTIQIGHSIIYHALCHRVEWLMEDKEYDVK